MSSSNIEADIVIAGGGATGCVIASRLAAADPSLRIVLVEAGPPTFQDLAHVQPARYPNNIVPGSATVKFYVGKESEDLGGRAPIVPCGQCLGGGSSVNFVMYTRPSASDYDDWETVHGNKGWSSRELIPLLQKMETYQIAPDLLTHGYDGPLKISYGGLYTQLGQQFLEVAAEYDKTRAFTEDPNGMYEINAYGRWPKYIDKETGHRSDIPHNYIYNRQLENLDIMTGYHVKRVVFEDGRATGIEFLPNARFRPDEKQEVRIAKARRLVIVCAGTFGSPAILERSGIGSEALLKSLGIQPIVDLPGVGENFLDHNVMYQPFVADDSAETLDGIVRNEKDENEKWTAQWERDGSGLLSHNGIDAGIKLRPSPEELEAIGPQFTALWERVFANAPDKPVIFMGILAAFTGDPSTVPPRKYFSVGGFTFYPGSVGHVHITSADDVNASPDFDPKYMSQSADIALCRWAYKLTREFARRMRFYRGELIHGHPIFAEGSRAACSADGRPVEIAEPNIEYSKEDDRVIDEHIRKVISTTWHNLGTCAMKPREQGGVVDAQLNVYGVTGLKVADMSIAPSNVASNTYSTAVVIGEKAVTIILKELGLTEQT